MRLLLAGGKQYRVSQGDVIYVEKLNNEVDDEVTFPVLMVCGEDNVEGRQSRGGRRHG